MTLGEQNKNNNQFLSQFYHIYVYIQKEREVYILYSGNIFGCFFLVFSKEWTEHSTLISENLKLVKISKNDFNTSKTS